MRLIELEIDYVRGLTHALLKLDGRNIIIWGPNGTGKSAVVDALDFLLTGEISRLTGQGTGGITLAKHGPHIDHSPEDAKVRAKVSFSKDETPFEISRCIQQPQKLNCPENKQILIEPILALAKRGNHVLTRQKILSFILAEGNSRAQNIQELLNIKDIEEIRRTFVKIENEAKKELQSAKAVVKQGEAAICSVAQIAKFSSNSALGFVNSQRAVFGKSPVSEFKSTQIKTDLALPTAVAGSQSINTTLLFNDLGNLRNTLDNDYQNTNHTLDLNLRTVFESIGENKEILRDISIIQFLRQGKDLIDDRGICPLCETTWKPTELRSKIDERLDQAVFAQQIARQINQYANELLTRIGILKDSLKRIIAISHQLQINEVSILENWEKQLSALINSLNDPIRNNYPQKIELSGIKNFYAPAELNSISQKIETLLIVKYPKATPEQTAWDNLTVLEANLKSQEIALTNLSRSELFYLRAFGLRTSFEKARDDVLKEIYNKIRDRFVGLYRSLHNEDEKGFNAVLEPVGPALKFEVDFFGRGNYPPQALHSEGHQDSMGICLYLALAEYLAGGILDLIILDDVVMSVDSDHRRKLCSLINKEFSNRQFLITTHDKTWATQLRMEGVATSKDVIEFANWTLEIGPQVCCENDLWDRIAHEMEENNVPSAAAYLRRGSEEYLSHVCNLLRAPVVFKLDGRWELGELLDAAKSKYKKLISNAKKSASFWGNKELEDKFTELNSIVDQVIARTQLEQWAVNSNVHYNNWANFTKNDFQPVIDAFQDLFGVFCCNKCGSLLFTERNGPKETSVRCKCNEVNWNLVSKE